MNDFNFNTVTLKMYEFFAQLSDEYGLFQDPTKDMVLVLLVLFVLFVIFSIIAVVRKIKSSGETVLEARSGLVGRLEKMEMGINQLRTEFARQQQFSKSEIQFIHEELKFIKQTLGQTEEVAGESVDITTARPVSLDEPESKGFQKKN